MDKINFLTLKIPNALGLGAEIFPTCNNKNSPLYSLQRLSVSERKELYSNGLNGLGKRYTCSDLNLPPQIKDSFGNWIL